MGTSFSIQHAARELADIEDSIEWCRRCVAGGTIHNDERLLAIFRLIRPDYSALGKLLEEKRSVAEAGLIRHMPHLKIVKAKP